jgi:UDP-N-acetylmuramoyl-tripeptide--D-alanyl-D-alanine ligase
MYLSETSRITGGEHVGADAEFASVSIDTRTLKPGDLFFAIGGTRFDGHDFVPRAAAAGACAAVVERRLDALDIPQIVVADARIALGQVGAAWRRANPARVIGITGSNGKTTAKEMVAAILEVSASVLKTRGNLNNDLGVPLTLMELGPEHRYAVIEMGANHFGEIAYVAALAAPQAGLITNAGAAHLEGFGSREGVARAKGELIGALVEDGIAILNADDPFEAYWRGLVPAGRRVVSFGFAAHADVRGLAETISVSRDESGFSTHFAYEYQGRREPIRLSVAGRHNVANALAATAACLALEIGAEQIAAGLAKVKPVPGRMQPETGRNGGLFINDTYNANPSSFSAALDVLLTLPGEPWLALGAFGELGQESGKLHWELGEEARNRGVKRLFAMGPNTEQAVAAFGPGAAHYAEPSALIKALEETVRDDVVVLVKGSRSQRMEQVIEALCRSARENLCC